MNDLRGCVLFIGMTMEYRNTDLVKTGNPGGRVLSSINISQTDCQFSFLIVLRCNNQTEGNQALPNGAFAVSSGDRSCHARKKLIDETTIHRSGFQGGSNQYPHSLDTGYEALSIHTAKSGGNDQRAKNPFASTGEHQINHAPANAPSNG
ncbi:MAG: hypothetical protein ACLQVX_23015 [Limisphaerales bacterium]